MIRSAVLSTLPQKLHLVQVAFKETGGLHAASLFTSDGELHSIREDVGRHNAVDKLLGEAFLQDAVPLRSHLVLLSGRASFELLQKAVMGGIPMVAAIGAPLADVTPTKVLFVMWPRSEGIRVKTLTGCTSWTNTGPCCVCTVTELAVTAVTAPRTGVTPAGKV
jgi:hypothetical protein